MQLTPSAGLGLVDSLPAAVCSSLTEHPEQILCSCGHPPPREQKLLKTKVRGLGATGPEPTAAATSAVLLIFPQTFLRASHATSSDKSEGHPRFPRNRLFH